MKERPILFSTEMVKAILNDFKTQTRRVIKPQPTNSGYIRIVLEDGRVPWPWAFEPFFKRKHEHSIECPYGQVSDRLWVRETFRYVGEQHETGGKVWVGIEPPLSTTIQYRADNVFRTLSINTHNTDYHNGEWTPSIFMPKWAARIWLEITTVRVERLQEITEEDANAEGNPYPNMGGKGSLPPLWWYRKLWDSLNARRGYGWDTNPWCWCISFKRFLPHQIGQPAAK